MRIARPHTLALIAGLAAIVLIAVCFGAVRGELAVGSWGSPDAGGQQAPISLADVPDAPARSGGDARAAEAATVALAPAATVAASAPAGTATTPTQATTNRTERDRTDGDSARGREDSDATGGRSPAGAVQQALTNEQPERADELLTVTETERLERSTSSSTQEGPAATAAALPTAPTGCQGEVPAGVELEETCTVTSTTTTTTTVPAQPAGE
jgi:hypothetical protein